MSARRDNGQRRGQAMIESLIVLVFLLAAFYFLYDFAYAAVARTLLENGAASAARADAVGFNDFQQAKSLRVGMIPVSGRRLVPDGGRQVNGAGGELALVRTYLQTQNWSEANGVLNYERWEGLTHTARQDGGLSRVEATFEMPMGMPWRLGAIFGYAPWDDTREIRADWAVEDHASLYLSR